MLRLLSLLVAVVAGSRDPLVFDVFKSRVSFEDFVTSLVSPPFALMILNNCGDFDGLLKLMHEQDKNAEFNQCDESNHYMSLIMSSFTADVAEFSDRITFEIEKTLKKIDNARPAMVEHIVCWRMFVRNILKELFFISDAFKESLNQRSDLQQSKLSLNKMTEVRYGVVMPLLYAYRDIERILKNAPKLQDCPAGSVLHSLVRFCTFLKNSLEILSWKTYLRVELRDVYPAPRDDAPTYKHKPSQVLEAFKSLYNSMPS